MASVPAISVLMPAYNVKRYIRESVDSVLRQTFANFEFIIIDDGSTDGTGDILREYAGKDGRLRLVSRPNTGYAAALNEALAMARAPFIARMDSDDVCLPQRLERQIAYMRQHDDCVLVGCRVLLIDEDGAPMFEMPGIELDHDAIDRQLLTAGWPIVHPAAMMRRDAVQRIGGYNADLMPVEDHDLFLRLAEIGKLANLPDVLFKYRKHQNSAVTTLGHRRQERFRKLLEDAWTRRGIAHRDGFPALGPDVPVRPADRFRTTAWMSLKGGHVSTARKYAFAAVRAAPLEFQSWKALLFAFRGH